MKTLANLTNALKTDTSAVMAQVSQDNVHDMQLQVPSAAIVHVLKEIGLDVPKNK